MSDKPQPTQEELDQMLAKQREHAAKEKAYTDKMLTDWVTFNARQKAAERQAQKDLIKEAIAEALLELLPQFMPRISEFRLTTTR